MLKFKWQEGDHSEALPGFC